MSNGSISKPVVMIGRRLREPAANDHTVALANGTVTNDAVNVVSIFSPIDKLFRDGNREFIDVIGKARDQSVACRVRRGRDRGIRIRIVDLTCVQSLILFQKPACDRSLRQIPGSSVVAEKLVLLIRLVSRLILHVEANTAARRHDAEGSKQ